MFSSGNTKAEISEDRFIRPVGKADVVEHHLPGLGLGRRQRRHRGRMVNDLQRLFE